jgi:hypothetical protein
MRALAVIVSDVRIIAQDNAGWSRLGCCASELAGFRRDRDNEVASNSAIGSDANELWCLDGAAVECVHAARRERTPSRDVC